MLSCCWQGGTFLWWPKELKIISSCKSEAFTEKIHKAYSTEGTGKSPVFTGLFNPTCTRVHRKKSAFDWLWTVLHRSYTCSYSGIQASPPLPHWNYFELFYARLQQEELSESEPNPAYTSVPQRQEVASSSVRGPRNETPIPSLPLGERRLSPSQWHIPERQIPFWPRCLLQPSQGSLTAADLSELHPSAASPSE